MVLHVLWKATGPRLARLRAWIVLQRFRWRAVVWHSSSQFLTVTLGGISIALAIWTIVAERPWSSDLPRGVVVAVVVLIPALAGFVITLRTMPAVLHAQALVDGQREMAILLVISRSIDRLCHRFLRKIRQEKGLDDAVEALFARPDTPADPATATGPKTPSPNPADLLRRIDRHVGRVETLIHRHHKQLRRLEEMKVAAAVELDVHPRRLCDHVLQFSPTIFRAGTWKYLDIWRLLRELAASERGPSRSRARAERLLRQARSLEADCEKRRIYQEQVIKFAFLHEAIIGFAGSRSTSGSLREYASAISYLARYYRGKLDRGRGRLGSRSWLPEATESLAFLYRKQRAHPGFDLHTLLTRLCDERAPGKGAAAAAAFDQSTALKAVVRGGPKDRPSLSRGQLDALAKLHFDVQEQVATARTEIVERVRKLLAQRPRSLFVVTNGYSKTVRDVLGRAPLPDDVQAYLLLQGTEHHLPTRIMKSEVKHATDALRHSRGRIACGSLEMLLGLLGEKHRVLVLLGAECFDDEGRVAHPRGMGSTFDRLTEELSGRGIQHLVMAVAEHYKKVSSDLASSPFYTDHFDGVDIYRPGTVDLIVSDRDIWPRNWASVWTAALGRTLTP
jgi:hypothetical protein